MQGLQPCDIVMGAIFPGVFAAAKTPGYNNSALQAEAKSFKDEGMGYIFKFEAKVPKFYP